MSNFKLEKCQTLVTHYKLYSHVLGYLKQHPWIEGEDNGYYWLVCLCTTKPMAILMVLVLIITTGSFGGTLIVLSLMLGLSVSCGEYAK